MALALALAPDPPRHDPGANTIDAYHLSLRLPQLDLGHGLSLSPRQITPISATIKNFYLISFCAGYPASSRRMQAAASSSCTTALPIHKAIAAGRKRAHRLRHARQQLQRSVNETSKSTCSILIRYYKKQCTNVIMSNRYHSQYYD